MTDQRVMFKVGDIVKYCMHGGDIEDGIDKRPPLLVVSTDVDGIKGAIYVKFLEDMEDEPWLLYPGEVCEYDSPF